MDTQEKRYADRASLRTLMRTHPEWTNRQFAEALDRSVCWVKKWRARLRQADPADEIVLKGKSHTRTHPNFRINSTIVARILQIRDEPPYDLNRVPGPRTILYYLARDPDLLEEHLPQSTRTVWQILVTNMRIVHAKPRKHQVIERPAPLSEWQMDFKDATSVNPFVNDKLAHQVEVLNIIDKGTSILIDALVAEDFNAETALRAIAEVMKAQGLPDEITIDRDPRWVGSPSGRDYPSALLRFLACLGVRVNICPPHRPDLNCFVERYNGSFGRECLDYYRPTDTATVRERTAAYKEHYNNERPNQAITCRNQPPRQAFPQLPSLPVVRGFVDTASWLQTIDGRSYARKVNAGGVIAVDKHEYYVKKELSGQAVVVKVEAKTDSLAIYHKEVLIKRAPIKGLTAGCKDIRLMR